MEYRPTDELRKAKIHFWLKVKDTLLDEKDINDGHIAQFLDARRASLVQRHLSNPAFRSWFLDTFEGKARLEYLYCKSLDAAEELLNSTDPKLANAKVQAMKLIAELGSKIKPRNAKEPEEDNLARLVGGMDQVQLKGILNAKSDQPMALHLAATKVRKEDDDAQAQ
jgi:hypothetical protein